MLHIPESLLQELEGVPGFDRERFVAAHAEPAVVSVRTNPRKDISLFSSNERVPWCTAGVYLQQRPVFTLDPAYHAGAYYVQEASSMFIGHILQQLIAGRTNLRVLDLCAAPGGKSTLIASLLDEGSLLISNEVIRSRASILEENMTRWGYINTWVTSNDARDLGKLEGYFDIIVVDAPCSGSGLWRKDEKALDEWSEGNVQLCSERQQRILADVWPALKQDGILIYATCSYSPAEDELIMDWLAESLDAATVPVAVVESWGITTTQSAKGMYGYRFFPGRVKGEGFFAGVVRRTDESNTLKQPRPQRNAGDSKLVQQASHLLAAGTYSYLQPSKDVFAAVHAGHEPDWQLLSKSVYLRKTGVHLGSPAAKEWLPDHDVAMSIHASKTLPCINVSREQALKFLKREDMAMADVGKGWAIVKYEGLGLGWIKGLGNRVNNYLPKHWRIRMDIE